MLKNLMADITNLIMNVAEPSERDEVGSGNSNIAEIVRQARKRKNWTLEEVSQRAGIGRSTLSKIENGQSTPSFEIVRKLTAVLDISTPQLFVQSAKSGTAGRRDITHSDEGEVHTTPTYQHRMLCGELTSKSMLPYITKVTARSADEFPEWIRHSGEEFLLVLEGEIELHTEHYKPSPMSQGDSAYYDSGMGHFCISTSKEDARILWVSLTG